MRRPFVAALMACCAAGLQPASAAEIFEDVTVAPVLQIDPSVRSVGMGGAGTAAFWGIDPNHWANPALLGYASGIRYEQGSTKIYEGVLDFRSRRTTLGGAGLGISAVGQPFERAGTVETDFSFGLDDGTQVRYVDRVRSWGVGASLGRLTETISRSLGREPIGITRYADVAVGFAEKRVEEIFTGVYAPSSGTPPSTSEHGAVARDWGVLVKAGIPVRFGARGAGRLEGAYGFADLGYNQPLLFGLKIGRDSRNGVALRMTFDPAEPWTSRLPGWFARGLEPMVSVAGAFDAHHTSSFGPRDQNHWGAELGLANAVFGRFGESAVEGDATQNTWGFGLGLPLGGYGGFRYDHANVARADGLDDLTRDSWTVWMDPIAVARLRR